MAHERGPPEEGAVRIALFAALAGLLVVALCVPEAFDESALDMAGPLLFGSEGWKLERATSPSVTAIVIIALGESIVAIGAGAELGVTAGVVVAAVVGIAIAAASGGSTSTWCSPTWPSAGARSIR